MDDIRGKRIRATGPYNNVLAELGADTLSMTFGEVYQALDTGLADCSASYFYTMKAYKTYEAVESVTRVDWGQLLGFAIVMNEFVWADLDEKQQAILMQAGNNMIDYFSRLTIADAEKVVSDLANGGFGKVVPVLTIAPKERQKILDATLKFRDSWIEEASRLGMDGQRIWNRYIELLKKYQSQLETKGYPWES